MKVKRAAAIQILEDLQAEGLDYIDVVEDFESMSNGELRERLCHEGIFRDATLEEVI